MLDFNSPMAKHILHASRLMDAALKCGQRMSVSPSVVRAELLQEAKLIFAEMRELAKAHFKKENPFIAATIDEYEAALQELAGLGGGQITEDRRNGEGNCAVCDTPLTHMRQYGIVLCRTCDARFMKAQEKLDRDDGFGTWII